ncbi:amidohydrolase [Salinibacter grassmerensis]|uniref:amidohydrolase n=1 Tax=Salinibacter grassmerensis TaxID=3040353 RepID=UPI0021E7D9CD|nr:amidohydrolase [Salinibacter grassmerensis]
MPSSELLITNARVHPVNDARDEPVPATALAVRDGRIAAVGSSAEASAAVPGARRMDAGGRTIVPGFIDAHAHLQELGLALRRADLTDASSPDAVVEQLRSFVADHDHPPDAWLRGHGWDQTEWTPARLPSRSALDAAFPERPVWLTRTDVHAGWANTAALEATVGLNRLHEMSDPDGGHIHRDGTGVPTGVLVDAAMTLVEDHIPPPSEAQQERALSAALRQTARRGITSLHDAGLGLSTLRRVQRFLEEGRFPLRLYAMIDGRGDTLEHFCDRGPLHHPSGRLDVESVKFFADGALGSRGAALLEDYADASGNRGFLLHEDDAFREHVRVAHECGFQVNTHAIGDRANRQVLDAYEDVARKSPHPLRRPRIEHAQIVAPEDRSRFGRLGVIASVQPAFAPSDHDWAPARLGPDRITDAYAWRSLQDAGARLAFGSDAPVEPPDPIRGFHAAVTRQDADGAPDGGWQPNERLARATALHAHTWGAAYAAFQEDEIGSISAGKRADFVVLSQDLMTVPADRLLDTEVVATYLGGTPVHTTPDWPDAH